MTTKSSVGKARAFDSFTHRGSGLYQFGKLTADFLSTMVHQVGGMTVTKVSGHLQDLGIRGMLEIRTKRKESRTGPALVTLARAVRNYILDQNAMTEAKSSAKRSTVH